MKKITIYTLLVCISLLWIGCQEDPEPGGTAIQDVAGEWWVRIYIGGTTENDIVVDYVKVTTFNTASNSSDSLWIYDNLNIWEFQVKAGYDKANKSFSASQARNISYPDSEVTITDGKVLLGQGRSSSGVQTDSIHFVVSFNDDTDANGDPDPYGTQYIIAGHRRTGFLEDEHE
jgi:hypothetical protein